MRLAKKEVITWSRVYEVEREHGLLQIKVDKISTRTDISILILKRQQVNLTTGLKKLHISGPQQMVLT